MEGIQINSLSYDVDIWCDCGTKFNACSDSGSDSKCPGCGAMYGMLPARVDGT